MGDYSFELMLRMIDDADDATIIGVGYILNAEKKTFPLKQLEVLAGRFKEKKHILIDAIIRQQANEFFNQTLKPILDSGSHKCPICDRSNCRGNTECIQCGAPMPITSQNTGPNAWHKPNREPLQ